MFQDFAQLFPWRTALGNVTFGLEMKGVAKAEREEIAREQLRAGEAGEIRQLLPASSLRRHAAARRHRARARLQSVRAADGRAVRGARCAHPRRHAAAAGGRVARDAQDRDLRDAQRRRGRVSRRPRDRDDAASRHREGARSPITLPRPRDPLSVEFLDYQKELLRLISGPSQAGTTESRRRAQRPSRRRRQ